MLYYKLALPIKPDRLYTYVSKEPVKRGCRVVVPFNNIILTGVCIEIDKEIDASINYREIMEVVDSEPLLRENLLTLAHWINRYYFTGLGLVLNAMLPSAFNVQIQLEMRRTKNMEYNGDDPAAIAILDRLDEYQWLSIETLKEDLKITAIYRILESLEDNGFIEINRVFDRKIKKKFANFVTILDVETLPKLTDKQQACLSEIKGLGDDVPLAKIASNFSYSIVKALRNKGLIAVESREIRENYQLNKIGIKRRDFTLTNEQTEVIDSLCRNIASEQFKTFLLHGVTGSGKTEVYIAAIKEALSRNRTALMLVPEISLTPQMVARLFGAFGEDIAILHSKLNDRERWEEWKKISQGESSIVVGARSAIFAPLENIGVIIVDEEHESSYKQESAPRYSGRDLAVLRAQIEQATCILGSATPSLETWNNAISEKFVKLSLTKRPVLTTMPNVKIIDMRLVEDKESYFSEYLLQKIEEKITAKEQVILFQNRRGHSSFVQCMNCGELFTCSECDISMNYHSYSQELICHYCGNKQNMPRKCPKCGSYHFIFGSPGTQQIEKSLNIFFPNAVIKRMDSDSANKKDSYDSMYEQMSSGSIDILLGTQMIAKGLDFPNVTLVGVISADISLNIPDFRAGERTFQLLTQVAGRSGRGTKEGEVIVQTYNPDHYAIQYALKHDFVNFAIEELAYRKTLKYPPIWKIARFVFSHKNEDLLKENINKNNNLWKQLNHMFREDVLLLGPIAAPIQRMQDQYRYHLIIKAANNDILNRSVRVIRDNIKLLSTIKYFIDIDPASLL